MTEKACKACHFIISEGSACPVCSSTDLSERWDSYVLIFDAEKSELAKKLNAKTNGKYAVRIK
jgi:DNA-directed RNA polymerase subunit E"